MAASPSTEWLDKVHSLMSARGIGWNEAWSAARTFYPAEYAAMKSAGQSAQSAANERQNRVAKTRIQRENPATKQFREGVNEAMTKHGLSYDAAWRQCKRTHPDLFREMEAVNGMPEKSALTPDGQKLIPEWPVPPQVLGGLGLPLNATREIYQIYRTAERVQVTPELAAKIIVTLVTTRPTYDRRQLRFRAGGRAETQSEAVRGSTESLKFMPTIQIQNSTAEQLSPLSKPLAPELKSQLQERRDAIATALAGIKDASDQLNLLEELRSRLLDDINRAEQGLDVADAKGAAGLAAKREQFRIAVSRLQSLKNQTEPGIAALAEALEPLYSRLLIYHALGPEKEALIESIASAMRPHFRDDHRARVCASQTDSVLGLQFFLSTAWHTYALQSGPKALGVLDALLAGRNPCRFEANPNTTDA